MHSKDKASSADGATQLRFSSNHASRHARPRLMGKVCCTEETHFQVKLSKLSIKTRFEAVGIRGAASDWLDG